MYEKIRKNMTKLDYMRDLGSYREETENRKRSMCPVFAWTERRQDAMKEKENGRKNVGFYIWEFIIARRDSGHCIHRSQLTCFTDCSPGLSFPV